MHAVAVLGMALESMITPNMPESQTVMTEEDYIILQSAV